MTRMIPPRAHPDAPSSEKRVFSILKDADHTDGWFVLHSLALAKRGRKAFGEVDFVVGVPDHGILVIEVKGGRIVCDEGQWASISRGGVRHPLKRPPIVQARDAAFEIRDQLQGKFGRNSGVGRMVVGAIVAFPDSLAPPDQPALERWEVLDHHDLSGNNVPGLIVEALVKTIDRLSAEERREHASIPALKDALRYLRPSFDGALPRAAHIRHQEQEVIRLTERQFDILDMLSENDRCLIKGAAGTGKTVLALEDARRSGLAGESTLLLCYNRPLAESLKLTLEKEGVPNVEVGTFHSFLRRRILDSEFANEFSQAEEKCRRDRDTRRLFDEVYPHYGQLAALGVTDRYSRLVIDEGQDLLRSAVLTTLQEWLVGGLDQGRWAIYGDFERQAIYSGDTDALDAAMDRLTRDTSIARTRLSRNFRNSPPIGLETAILSGFEELPYSIPDTDLSALPVDYHQWVNRTSLVSVLEEETRRLIDSGVAAEDIVILSPKRFRRSAASDLTNPRVSERKSPWAEEGRVGFSTIHRFKGLESPVVLLSDIDSITAEGARELLYVGMSRARSYLAVFLSRSARAEVRTVTKAYLEQNRDR